MQKHNHMLPLVSFRSRNFEEFFSYFAEYSATHFIAVLKIENEIIDLKYNLLDNDKNEITIVFNKNDQIGSFFKNTPITLEINLDFDKSDENICEKISKYSRLYYINKFISVVDHNFLYKSEDHKDKVNKYIKIMNELINMFEFQVFALKYYGVLFEFEKNKKIHSNILSKALDCFPQYLLSCIDFRKKVEFVAKNQPHSAFSGEKGFIKYLEEVFDYTSNIFKPDSEKSEPDKCDPRSENNDSLVKCYPFSKMPHVFNGKNDDRLDGTLCFDEKSEDYQYTFLRNWFDMPLKDYSSVAKSCFFYLSTVYFIVISSESTEILRVLNSDFSLKRYGLHERVPIKTSKDLSLLSIESQFISGNLFNSMVISNHSEDFQIRNKNFEFTNISLYIKWRKDIILNIKNAEVRCKPFENVLIIINFENSLILPYEEDAEQLVIEMLVNGFDHSFEFENCVFEHPLYFEKGIRSVSIIYCITPGRVYLRKNQSIELRFKNNSINSTVFELGGMVFTGIKDENVEEIGYVCFSEGQAKIHLDCLTLMSIPENTAWISDWSLSYVVFENIEHKKNSKIKKTPAEVKLDSQSEQKSDEMKDALDLFQFNFKIVKQMTIHYSIGTVCIKNYYDLPKFHIVLSQLSDITILSHDFRLSNVSLLSDGEEILVSQFEGKPSEFKNEFFRVAKRRKVTE